MNAHTPQRCLLACLLGMALCQAANAASTIVDNGPPDHLSGQNLNYAFQAEDFRVNSEQAINRITFWTLEAPDAWRGSFSFSILGDAGGAPGTTVWLDASGIGATRTSTGNYLGLTEYRNEIDLAFLVSATLNPGNYWLVLHSGPQGNLDDGAELLWETTAMNATANGLEASAPNGPWTGTNAEHAFEIAAIPEPGRLSMLLAGILAVAGITAARTRGGAK